MTSMNRFLHQGVYTSAEGLAPDDSNLTRHNPMTFVTVSKDGKKVWLVEVDGRSRQSTRNEECGDGSDVHKTWRL